MGYLYWLCGMVSGTIKGFCGKKMSAFVNKPGDAMLANTLRMVLCIIVGLFVVVLGEGAGALAVDSRVMYISLLSGVASAVNVVAWVLAVKRGAYMLNDVFGTLGIMIPLLLSSAMFGEQVKTTQWIGFVILIAAVLVMCSYSSSIKQKLNFYSIFLLTINGAAAGFSSFSQKMFVRMVEGGSIAVFNFYTYVFAAATLMICYLVSKRDKTQGEEKFRLKNVIWYVAIMAVCLFAYSYFMTYAAQYLDSAQLYPLNTGMSLVLGTAMSAVFFDERVTIKSVVGIVLTFVALIVINVL